VAAVAQDQLQAIGEELRELFADPAVETVPVAVVRDLLDGVIQAVAKIIDCLDQRYDGMREEIAEIRSSYELAGEKST
jgi:hypothetical protein